MDHRSSRRLSGRGAAIVLALSGLVACGPQEGARSPNGSTAQHTFKGVQVSPSDPVLFLDNNKPVTQAFTATMVYADGKNTDVTAQATFTVEKAGLGGFAGSTFNSGTTGGFTKVIAQVNGMQGYTVVTLVPRRLDASGMPLDFFFIAPYNAPPTPTSATLSFSTNIQQADVGFIVDTTGSMATKIDALHTSLSSLAATLKTKIPSVGMGVGDYRSWPCEPDGGPLADWVFKLTNRIITVKSGGLSAIQSAIGALMSGGGGDGPESGFDAIFAAASGQPLMNCDGTPGLLVPPFNAASAPGAVAGETTGALGGMGFRAGSLPVLVLATDAELHDADDPADTTFAPIKPFAKGHTAALAALNGIGGRFVGIASTSGGSSFTPTFAGPSTQGAWEPYSQMVWMANQTHSQVPVAAFAGACGVGQCCTGLNGTGVPPDSSGLCPLVYKTDANGSGLGNSVADAISKLVSFGGFDDSTQVTGKTTDESMPGVPLPGMHTTADFLQPADAKRGVTPLDSTPAVSAPGGPTAINLTKGAFMNVQPGTTLRFVVTAYNDFVPATTEPQFFKANIGVMGDGAALLDQRDVYILVPPGGDILQ
jgi:hypothetical protein